MGKEIWEKLAGELPPRPDVVRDERYANRLLEIRKREVLLKREFDEGFGPVLRAINEKIFQGSAKVSYRYFSQRGSVLKAEIFRGLERDYFYFLNGFGGYTNVGVMLDFHKQQARPFKEPLFSIALEDKENHGLRHAEVVFPHYITNNDDIKQFNFYTDKKEVFDEMEKYLAQKIKEELTR